MKRPSGITLVEVILAIVIATSVMGVLAAVVSRMIASNAAAHEHLRTVVTLGRLGEQFRRDAHASHRATIEESNDEPARLTLHGEGSIEYEITPAGLERVATNAGRPEHRDLFVLPGMKFLGWQMDDDGREISLVIGRLARPQSEDATLGGRFSIVASLAGRESSVPSP